MLKLELPDWLIQVTKDWMEVRSYQVRFRNETSRTRFKTKGLPQRSPMSAALLKIYVVDLPTFIKKKFVKTYPFADDTAVDKAYAQLRTKWRELCKKYSTLRIDGRSKSKL